MKKAETQKSLEALATDNNFEDIPPHLRLTSEYDIRKSIKQSNYMSDKV